MNSQGAGVLLATIMLIGCGSEGGTSTGATAPGAPAADRPVSNIVPVSTSKTFKASTRLLNWGDALKLVESHKSQVVVIDVWQLTCQPCIREFPGLVALQDKYKNDVACISVNIDFDGHGSRPSDELQKRILDFLASHKADIENVICSESSEAVYNAAEFVSLPAVFVFDRQGARRKLFTNENKEFGDGGFTYTKDIDPLVAQLVAEGKHEK